jgi:hypothetical protein
VRVLQDVKFAMKGGMIFKGVGKGNGEQIAALD